MKKKNLKYQITYILFILFFLTGAIFYRQSFLAVLLILLCVLPIISIYLLVALGKNITFKTVAKTDSVTAGNNIVILATIKNPYILPFLNCEVFFELQNLFFENDIAHLSDLIKKYSHSIYLPYLKLLMFAVDEGRREYGPEFDFNLKLLIKSINSFPDEFKRFFYIYYCLYLIKRHHIAEYLDNKSILIKVTDKELTLDLNHELAGKSLIFDITIKQIY